MSTEYQEPTGNLALFVQSVRKIMVESSIDGLSSRDLASLQDLIGSTEIPEEDWKPFLFYKKDGYARNLVDNGNGNFDLILLSWTPNSAR